ncbi:MAG: glycerol-3-phosphate dehydrogenase [Granulosicoccus sp.]|nr:glycerol-3-phosphate dehydrogenase [Granulosicoccus sp.]
MHTDEPFDICVIGGGVNGAGISRDAAGRGLKVALIEQGDLAEGTSSRSGKLIHGGLRYLEYYEFRLVREALIEREVLLEAAPHIIWPMRFVLPHSPAERPAWLVRAGLFLYDHLGGRKRLAGTRSLDLSSAPEGDVIKPDFKRAFEYSDCWVDDARLTILNALCASEKGAAIYTRTRCAGAQREDATWRIDLVDVRSGEKREIYAKALINAAGPWVNSVIESIAGTQSRRSVRQVKGSHLIMKKFWQGNHSYLIQNDDKRVIFVNPFEDDYALIGTTDIAYEGDPANVSVDQDEIDYLLNSMNRYFVNQFSTRDVLTSFSGVRPLYDDNSENPSAVTRDYLFDLDQTAELAPLLNIYGGKITTYRKLAEHALDKLASNFPDIGSNWTASEPLPGGDIADADFDKWFGVFRQQYQQLPDELLHHYARLYGTRAEHLLNGITTCDQLGRFFGHTLYEAEVRYLVDVEWAQTSEDILERRTKHGLHLSANEQRQFIQWFEREFSELLLENDA